MERLQFWRSGSVEYLFIAITLKSTLTWTGNTYYGPVYIGQIDMFKD